jgi:outer membrane PBP1 activator LpoA protein
VLASCASDPAYRGAPIEDREVTEVTPLENQRDGQRDQTTPFEDRQIGQRDLKIERAEYYQQLASSADDARRIDSVLSSAEYYIQGDDFYSAEQAASSLAGSTLEQIQRDRYDVIYAYVGYSKGDITGALYQLETLLDNTPIDPLPDEANRLNPHQQRQSALSRQQVDALLLSSFCYQQLGDYGSAIEALIRREAGLVGAARAETTRYTWQLINSIHVDQRRLAMQSTNNALVRNRLEQSVEGQVGRLEAAPQQFTQWREDESAGLKQTINNYWSLESPRSIAVLLPLNSKFNQAAQALLDGFKYQNEQNLSTQRPQISIYDLGDNPYQASQYYAAAVQAGADLVVGPLGMEYANQLSSSGIGSVPTILLGGDQSLRNGTIRLTMSPEMEGRTVANKALRDGHLSAAILAPDDNNSQRTVNAFSAKWLQMGGKISKIVSYSPKQFDHSVELKQLFDINQSEYRHRQLSDALGLKPKFAAYQRSDIDFIFMLANTDTGRIVRPQINFFSGSKLPVYATSKVFNGIQDAVYNMDLERTHFPVMPWVMKSANVAQYAGQLNELFALGGDAYRLAGNFSQLQTNPELAINGSTGQLSIDAFGEVNHEPVWAQFQNGEAIATQDLGIDLSPEQGQGKDLIETKQGVYNDSNWDSRNARRKTGT